VKKLEAFLECIHVFYPNLPVTPIAQKTDGKYALLCKTFMRFCCHHLQKIACRQAYKMHYAKILQLSRKEV